jgi:SAM-dependent methyltransferase
MKKHWNTRFSSEDYVFGREPNSFLKKELQKLKPGKILFVGEGEGRNAVYASSLGWDVDAIDFSEEGKRKAEKLAEEIGVKINYQIHDFSSFVPKENYYDAVGIFFIHLEEELRTKLFQKTMNALKSSGKIIFECFEKEQIGYESGGPKDTELLYSLEDVVNLFIELDFEKLTKEKIYLSEGKGHLGEGIVIRFIGSRK